MMDDQALERGLRARPPADPVYRSRIAETPLTHVRSRPASTPHARSLSRALRLAAVAALLVAGGGVALLVGSSPEKAQPTPTPWQPPASLVTEPVEPGVERVISDGHRDLSWDRGLLGYYGGEGEIVVGMDGGIWNVGPFSRRATECAIEPCVFYRIGDPETHDRVPAARWLTGGEYAQRPAGFAVGPDGTVWATVRTSTGSALYSYDGANWTLRWTPPAERNENHDELAIGSDGSVWFAWTAPESTAASRVGIVRLRGDQVTQRLFDLESAIEGSSQLVSSPDGRYVLLQLGSEILRLGGPAGEIIAEPFAVTRSGASPWLLKVGDEGTVVYEGELSDEADQKYYRIWRARHGRDGDVLADAMWEPVPDPCAPAHVAGVGPDGEVWMVPNSDAGRYCGLIRWRASDGDRAYLRDYAIASLAIAPDGSVWLQAVRPDEPDKGGSPQVDVFVVRPNQGEEVE